MPSTGPEVGQLSSHQLWLYPRVFSTPDQAVVLADTDETWAQLLDGPSEIPPDQKAFASAALCGAQFQPAAPRRSMRYVVSTHALVLDVDQWSAERPPFTDDELRERLRGIRAICYTSFSTTSAKTNWRVIIPLATPCPLAKHVALFRAVVGACLDGTVSDSVRDATRYGFVGTCVDASAYRWFIVPGERLDWAALDLQDETPYLVPPLDAVTLAEQPGWIPRSDALATARREYRTYGTGVAPGSRHVALFKLGCTLWWDWALGPDEVQAGLLEVNSRFVDPAPDAYVLTEVERSHDRTLGDNRVIQAGPYGSRREPEARISTQGVEGLARRLRSGSQEAARALGRALKAIADGEAFASPADAGIMASRSAAELAQVFHQDSPERILALMAPALATQRAVVLELGERPFAMTDADVLVQIKAVQARVAVRQEHAEQALQNKLTAQIRQATHGARDTPYTAAEYQAWQADGFDDRQWILQLDRSYYFRVGTAYDGPHSREAAAAFAHVFLAPATGRLTLTVAGKDGSPRRRTLDELVNDYGTALRESVRAMGETRDRFDVANGVLTQATSMLRVTEPLFSSQIDEWLRLLAGDKVELLYDWMADLTNTQRSLAALFFCTGPNSGKNLFVTGLSRLWNVGGPSSLHDINPMAIERCPLVLCDEYLPAAWERQFSTMLRLFCSRNNVEVNRKYLAQYTLKGFPRLVFAGNDPDMLATGREGTLRSAALDAVKERVLMIQHNQLVRDGSGRTLARQYLESVGQMTLDSWVEDDLMARHALWARDRQRASPRTRFGVVDPTLDFEHALVTGTMEHSRLYDWIYAYVTDAAFPGHAVRAMDGVLYVHGPQMFRIWSTYDNRRVAASERVMALALAALAPTRVKLRVGAAGVGAGEEYVWYRRLDMAKLRYWLSTMHGADDTTFDDAMAKLQADKVVTL